MFKLLQLSPDPPLVFMCEANLSVMLVPSTHSVDQPPHFVPKGWEWKGGKVETGWGRVQWRRACNGSQKLPL